MPSACRYFEHQFQTWSGDTDDGAFNCAETDVKDHDGYVTVWPVPFSNSPDDSGCPEISNTHKTFHAFFAKDILLASHAQIEVID